MIGLACERAWRAEPSHPMRATVTHGTRVTFRIDYLAGGSTILKARQA